MAQAKKRVAAKAAPAGSPQAVRRTQVARTDILVKAIGRGDGVAGYYNLTRYRDGDTFFLNKEEDFSERWMVAVDGNREEIPEETKRLAAIANATRRKAAAERAAERATFTQEIDPAEAAKQAHEDLEKAKAVKRHERAGGAGGEPGSGDQKRKIAGTDYERHEDHQEGDAEGPEPQGGRASDTQVA